MNNVLSKYLPENSINLCIELIKQYHVHLKIVNERVTRHGDYTRNSKGQHKITINANLNKYRFLITLIHEIAHLVVFKKFGTAIKPHGLEWKFTFKELMLPFIKPQIFPNNLLPLLAEHFKNPRASTDVDTQLSIALKEFDPENDKNYIFELTEGSIFKIYNGKVFKKGKKRIKRYICVEIASGRKYLFQPNAEVELIK